MTKDEALKLALEALETELCIDWTNNDEFNASAEKMHEAIAAIKAALAQPEQEPACPECTAAVLYECVACSSNNYPPKPVQEPVAWEVFYPDMGKGPFTTPPLLVQPEERNFCPRCGKRTADLTTIHTCTPPQENT